MEHLNSFLKTEYLDNCFQDYLIFISSIFLGLVFKGLISKYLSNSLYKLIGRKETRVGSEEFAKLLVKPISSFVMLSV